MLLRSKHEENKVTIRLGTPGSLEALIRPFQECEGY